MNVLDAVALGLIGLMAIWGVFRGAIREALSVLAWVAAWIVAGRFAGLAARYLSGLPGSEQVRHAAGYGVVFVLVLILFSLAAFLLTASVRLAGLGPLNRIAGFVLGGLRGMMVIIVLVVLAGLTVAPQTRLWHESRLAPFFVHQVLEYRTLLPTGLQQHLNYQG